MGFVYGSLSAILCLIVFATSSLASPTAYEKLEEYNLPIGILPKGVLGYELDPSTGKFYASFNSSCKFSLKGSYQLRYNPAIRGYVSQSRISGLEGVSVKLFLFWVDIVEVVRSGDDLEFSVGIAGAGFPVNNFEESPQCGCGLNCNDVEVIKLRSNPLVGSY